MVQRSGKKAAYVPSSQPETERQIIPEADSSPKGRRRGDVTASPSVCVAGISVTMAPHSHHAGNGIPGKADITSHDDFL
ncbi:hypothetical protein E2C01_064571 [Portunus trituberculatus]|uniref:Uncharacterized protein n=1 Tax=Portunus trituberculatus TaxID=210409 RepID=A0A5B7HM76_PORTR|nr:hypothetical protein [Portunus trituberculatus]